MTDKVLLIISLILGIPNILTTLISFSKKEYWWIRICDFPKLQMLFLMFASLVCFCITMDREGFAEGFYLSVLCATILFQAHKIRPYTVFHKLQSLEAEKKAKENQISLLYTNVLMTNRNSADSLKEMLRFDPDIILAVEADHWWQEKLHSLEEKYPYTAQLPLENTYGMLLYSKLPVEKAKFQFLTDNEIPSLNPLITLPSGVKINCFFIHPKPPIPKESKTSEQRDAELILVAKMVKSSKFPVIVAGDLNDVGWSRTSVLFQKISGLLDPRVGRGLFATYNAKYPIFRWPLDHVFHSNDFRVIKLKKLDFTGSDHLPLYVKLSYEPEGKSEQERLEAKEKDIKEANKKLG
jgi:endonuclease/exonuclease/phosphatase (EEP) superfamily protein YafD